VLTLRLAEHARYLSGEGRFGGAMPGTALGQPERDADQGREQRAIRLGQAEVAHQGERGGMRIAGRVVRDHLQQQSRRRPQQIGPGHGAVEDAGPYVLDDVLPEIYAGNHKRLPQAQFVRAAFLFIPRFFE
jgi:hypothetical protein